MEFHQFSEFLKGIVAGGDENRHLTEMIAKAKSDIDGVVKFDSRFLDCVINYGRIRPPYIPTLVRIEGAIFAFCIDLGDMVCMLIFCPWKDSGKWVASAGIALVSYDGRYANAIDPSNTGVGFKPGGILDASREVAKFLSLLNEPGQVIETHEPSRKLNAKRERYGKPPLVSYKTLLVKKPLAQSQGRDVGGTHASPRLHLRRGHIRRRFGREFWVRSTIVGDKSRGLLLKDYRLVSSDDNRTRTKPAR